MTREVVTIDLHGTVFEAAKLMAKKKVGCLVVMDDDESVGMVTERDFVRKVVAKNLPLDTQISDVMSKPLIIVDPDSSLKEAARLMVKKKIRRLPVIKDRKLIGIIVVSDFARHLSKQNILEKMLEAMARYPPDFHTHDLA